MAIKKYVKFDSEKGYIEDKDDINYFATNQMRKIAFGKMLGDFDENGLYVINQKIIEELIKMPKVIVEVLEEADLIRSKVKADSFFHFILAIEDNKASFKLLEKIHYQSNKDFNSGIYSNINEYVLDEVIIPDKDFDRNVLYQKYNISTDNNGDVLSIFDMDELSIALYYNIVEKLKINYLVQNELILKEKELESLEADYFEAVLEVLNEYKEFGDKVTESVKRDLVEKHNFVIISKPFFQKAINEIVDSYIDLHIQDLSPEQKEQVLIKIRKIKEEYYQKFKILLPIQIANKAGVRFDPNQILQQSVIGGLAQEIETKGFTSSDIRKILIKDDELQLSITKIKDMVKENEEICKRDNTKAKDITKNRPLTTEFYNKLEKENKVDILKPDTTLIKSAIDEKSAQKQESKKATIEVSSTASARDTKNTANTKVKQQNNGRNTSIKKTKVSAGNQQRSDSVRVNGINVTKTVEQQSQKSKSADSLFIYGSGVSSQTGNKVKTDKETAVDNKAKATVLDNILDTEMVADKYRKSATEIIDIDNSLGLR